MLYRLFKQYVGCSSVLILSAEESALGAVGITSYAHTRLCGAQSINNAPDIADWCNGSTQGFEPWGGGSVPSLAAKQTVIATEG